MKTKKEELQQKLITILNMETLNTVKISLIEALINQLKLNLKSQQQSIHPSQYEETPQSIQLSIQRLQEKIMMKRAIKFQLNEELEGVEDQLYEIEKVIETKRLCDDKMRREIDRKMLMIEWSQQKKETSKSIVEKRSKNKTLGNISTKLKNIFG